MDTKWLIDAYIILAALLSGAWIWVIWFACKTVNRFLDELGSNADD